MNRNPTVLSARVVLPVIVSALILASLIVILRSRSGNGASVIGSPAPVLSLVSLIDANEPDAEPNPALDLNAIDVAKLSLEDRVTVLHFWGTWCPPCKAEYPELVKRMGERASNPVLQFISVSTEGGEDETYEGLREKTQKYYETIEATGLTTYADANGVTRQASATILNRPFIVYPTTLVIDQNAKVAGLWQGFTRESVDEMIATVDRLLGTQPPST